MNAWNNPPPTDPFKRSTEKLLGESRQQAFKSCLKELEETEPADISVEEIGGLEVFVQKAQDALNNYEESVIKCLELEEPRD